MTKSEKAALIQKVVVAEIILVAEELHKQISKTVDLDISWEGDISIVIEGRTLSKLARLLAKLEKPT